MEDTVCREKFDRRTPPSEHGFVRGHEMQRIKECFSLKKLSRPA